jgi:nickel-dependent lactate racemase
MSSENQQHPAVNSYQAMSDECLGHGSPHAFMSEDDARETVADAVRTWNLHGQRVLVIIPDGTRTAPLPLFYRLLQEIVAPQAAALDFLVALGTHPPMEDSALRRLLGIIEPEQKKCVSQTQIFNHRWDLPETFITLDTITAEETLALSSGRLAWDVPVRINRLIFDYDLLLVCGPVFPHEVVGFSGGNKYFFPGISGLEMINYTHWLGALITSYALIGRANTPVRAVIDRGAKLIPLPRRALCMVVQPEGMFGLYAGSPEAAWAAAASLSAQVHVKWVERPFQRALAVMPRLYTDLWTGAKGMYKLEPVIDDGGEVIIYAPHITEVSYTHGEWIDAIGYHVRDYFTAQWERFQNVPWGVLAHSTHLRGIGSYIDGVERPRIQVTLATGIPAQRCAQLGVGYCDPKDINPSEWAGREAQGILLVPHAGEQLYRLAESRIEQPGQEQVG